MQMKKNAGSSLSRRPSLAPTVLRVVLAIYLVALVLSMPLILGLFGYGLAHAGPGAITGLLLYLAGIFLVAALPPLLLLLPAGNPALLVLKIIGGLVMLAGVLGMLKLLHFWLLEPQWMTMRHRHAIDAIEVLQIQEEPIRIDGRLIGLKVVREIDLHRAITLDRYGMHVLEAMRHLYVGPVQYRENAIGPFDEQVGSKLISVEGQPPVADFEALATSGPATVLQAGRYRSEHSLLLWGLSNGGWPAAPCRDEAWLAAESALHEPLSGAALQATSSGRFDLGYRRGYPTYTLPALPLQYRYDHAGWMQDVQRLPLETCEQRQAREEAAKLGAQRLQEEQWYDSGDSRLSRENNPLYREMCSDDLEAVTRRLARATPRFSMSGMIFECSIGTPRLEMFSATMPALFARVEERDGYCSIVSALHRNRSLAYLEALADLQLPILCSAQEDPHADYTRRSCDNYPRPDHCLANAAKGPDAWRAGLYPLNERGEQEVNADPSARQDAVRWLQFLQAQNVPICQTLPDNTNLLLDVVERFPAEVVHYLASAGCDAHVSPPAAEAYSMPYMLPRIEYSAAAHWFARSHGINAHRYAPVDPQQADLVMAAMGGLTAQDINRADTASGRTLLHDAARWLPENPPMWRYLLAHGARLDVADINGRSWFDRDYAQIHGAQYRNEEVQNRLFAMLDGLTVEQLNQLNRPVNTITGEPGLPIEEYDFEPRQLAIYLCARGAHPCD